MSNIKIEDEEKIISFLKEPVPIFTSLQQRYLYMQRELVSKTSIILNGIVKELIKELIIEQCRQELVLSDINEEAGSLADGNKQVERFEKLLETLIVECR